MKKINCLLLGVLSIAALAGCAKPDPDAPNTPEGRVLSYLKNASYKIETSNNVQVKRYSKYEISTYVDVQQKLGYFFNKETGELAHSKEVKRTTADMDSVEYEIDENTLKVTETPEQTYYKDEEGQAIYKTINVYNQVVSSIAAEFDSESGAYTPVMYDAYYTNPFNFVTARDLELDEEANTVSIDPIKAYDIASFYGAVGLNAVQGATIILDSNQLPVKIEFDIEDYVDEGRFTRTNEFEVRFTELRSAWKEVKPFENNNPDLAVALKKLENATNYTYYKDMMYGDEVEGRTAGYFTQDFVFYHQGFEEEMYTRGDNYDYVVKKHETDNLFYIYSYQTTDAITWYWVQEYSGEVAISYETFNQIGPKYYNISPAIFKSIGNNQYVCEDLVMPSIGSYFDNQCHAATTADFEKATKDCVVTLDGNQNIEKVELVITTGGVTYNYRFSYDNIGTTTIPSYVNFNL